MQGALLCCADPAAHSCMTNFSADGAGHASLLLVASHAGVLTGTAEPLLQEGSWVLLARSGKVSGILCGRLSVVLWVHSSTRSNISSST